MASVIFQNAERIIKQVFDWFQTSGQAKTNNLILDTFQQGIDNSTTAGEGFIVVPGTNNTIAQPSVNVTTGGIAYDNLANRIFISSSDTKLYDPTAPSATTNDGLGNLIPTPQSTGVINVPVTQSSQNYLWVNYLATIDPTAYTLNKETQAKQFYKQTDGYNITVTTVNIAPNAGSVYLANINMTAGGTAVQVSNISQVGRTYVQILPGMVPITTPLADLSDRTPSYAPATTYTLEAHIKAVGTGPGITPFNPHNTSLQDLGVSAFDTVQAHRQLEHGTNGSGPGSATDVNNAIIAGIPGAFPASYPNTSAMATDIIIATSDYILVHQLLSSEFAIVNGTAYNATAIFGAIPADATVMFPNASGTYNVYWDAVSQAFGTTTGSVAFDATRLWLCTVDYTYVGVLGHNALSNKIERRRIGGTSERQQRWVTTARPPNPMPGEYGYNLDINAPEWYDGTAWQSLNTPTGAILDFGGTTPPVGFLVNDGSVLSQTTFANLYGVIGSIYNTGGEGAGNFRLPNKQRRVSVGSGGTGTGVLGNTPGSIGGAETQTTSSHTHTENAHTHNMAHQHVLPLGINGAQIFFPATSGPNSWSPGGVNRSYNYWVQGVAGIGAAASLFYYLSDQPTVSNTGTQSDTGMSSATETVTVVQPSIVFTSIIKY